LTAVGAPPLGEATLPSGDPLLCKKRAPCGISWLNWYCVFFKVGPRSMSSEIVVVRTVITRSIAHPEPAPVTDSTLTLDNRRDHPAAGQVFIAAVSKLGFAVRVDQPNSLTTQDRQHLAVRGPHTPLVLYPLYHFLSGIP
jgi:hypothetical protein